MAAKTDVGQAYVVEFYAATSDHNADGKKDDFSSGIVWVNGKERLDYRARATVNAKTQQKADLVNLHFVATNAITTLTFTEEAKNCIVVRDIQLSKCKSLAGGCKKSCQGYTCDYWASEEDYTCATLEKDYGCNCAGCKCATDKKVCANDKCNGRSCDQWVANGVSCDILKKQYKCTCKLCQCNPPKPPEPCVIMTGVIDGPKGGPKAVELYTICDVKNLAPYGLGSANNGGGTDGKEFKFPKKAVKKGTFFYVGNFAGKFKTYFGFAPDYLWP